MFELSVVVKALQDAGAVIVVQDPCEHLSLGAVATRLDCSVKWVRAYLCEFPRRWRMPGGEWRIPVRDVEALAKRNRAPEVTRG